MAERPPPPPAEEMYDPTAPGSSDEEQLPSSKEPASAPEEVAPAAAAAAPAAATTSLVQLSEQVQEEDEKQGPAEEQEMEQESDEEKDKQKEVPPAQDLPRWAVSLLPPAPRLPSAPPRLSPEASAVISTAAVVEYISSIVIGENGSRAVSAGTDKAPHAPPSAAADDAAASANVTAALPAVAAAPELAQASDATAAAEQEPPDANAEEDQSPQLSPAPPAALAATVDNDEAVPDSTCCSPDAPLLDGPPHPASVSNASRHEAPAAEALPSVAMTVPAAADTYAQAEAANQANNSNRPPARKPIRVRYCSR
jgi:hypothetical protein